MQHFQFDIDPACEKKRLDVFLSEAQSDISRNYIQKLIEEGHVRVNDAPAKSRTRLKSGDRVEMDLPPAQPLEVLAEEIPLNILFEDAHFLIIDKPPGMVVHPGPGHCQGTLVNALLHHCQDLKGIGGVERPGIVHRLDKDTSGLIAVAKSADALVSLQKQFQDRTIRKVYLAFARGHLKPGKGIINSAIARHPSHRKKMAAQNEGKEAETSYEVVQQYPEFDLVRLFPKTGRTHQIRVHLASIGHPVMGDELYGGKKSGRGPHPSRQALHAHRLELDHPVTGQPLAFESPLPQDLLTWMENAPT